MTAEGKLWQLIQRLAEKTAQGAVVWEATAAQNTFQTSFPQYSVRIVELDYQDYRSPQYMLEMLDGNGNVIERVDGIDIQKAVSTDTSNDVTNTMRDLYRAARRHALGVDTALDSLLSELEKAR
jgi:23S rRNA maturation-related 3'-5' exoribonuclease YhaM